MSVTEGQRVQLTGRAWGYSSQNREVYARITFVDGGYAKIDEQEVLVSGCMVKGFEFEPAPEHARPTPSDLGHLLDVAASGIANELSKFDVRNQYTEAEMEKVSARWNGARSAMDALRGGRA